MRHASSTETGEGGAEPVSARPGGLVNGSGRPEGAREKKISFSGEIFFIPQPEMALSTERERERGVELRGRKKASI